VPLDAPGFGRKTSLRLWGKLGRSGVAEEVREMSDGGEGDRRRRRRGEVDWDELPTLIIWGNVVSWTAVTGVTLITSIEREARLFRIF